MLKMFNFAGLLTPISTLIVNKLMTVETELGSVPGRIRLLNIYIFGIRIMCIHLPSKGTTTADL